MTKPPIVDVTEQKRLNEAREARIPWKKWGPYLSERQWGTVREDYSDDGNAWAYFSHDQSRSRAYRWGEDGLGGICDDKQRLCFALALVERTRPDPEGAAVRPHQQRRQSRRGRQGVLLLRRQHADALVHEVPLQVSPAGVPVSGPCRDEPDAVAGGVRVRTARHRRVRRRPLLRRLRRIREGRSRRHPRPDHRPQPRPRSGAASCAADAVVPQHLVVGRGRPEAVAARGRSGHHRSLASRSRHVRAVVRRRAGAALHREREQRAAPVGAAQRLPVREGCVPHLRHHGQRRCS